MNKHITHTFAVARALLGLPAAFIATHTVSAALPTTVNFAVTYPGTGFGAPSYIDTNIFLSNPNINGLYDGWCIDLDNPINNNTGYTANVVLTTDPAAAGLVDLPGNLDLLNYVLNQVYSPPFIWQDVQAAIWTLLDTSAITDEDLVGFDQARVDAIVNDAIANGEGFVPDCGDLIGVILQPIARSSTGNPVTAQINVFALPVVCLGDYVWWDVDGDGIQDGDEPGVEGVVVNLLDCFGNPVLDGLGDPIWTTTDGDGFYEFTNLIPGCYRVEFVNDDGFGNDLFTFTTPNANGNTQDTEDSDADPVTGQTGDIDLTTVSVDYTNDAGILFAALGDYVWEDLNGDGIQDAGEPGVNGVIVNLLDCNGDPILDEGGFPASTTTANFNGQDGYYEFLGLLPGCYIVEFENTDGSSNTLFEFTTKDANGNAQDAEDSDADLVTGRSDNINLAAGQFDDTIDAGIRFDQGECAECDGKVVSLVLANTGPSGVVTVKQKDGTIVFHGFVASGDEFSFTGTDKKGTLGTEISIYVDHVLNTKIHTSCSQPIGPGLQSGDFLVIAGTSRNGGELCPVDVPPPNGDCGECDGKVVSLVLANTGPSGVVTVKQKDGTIVFHGFVASGDEFSFTGTDKKGTLGTEISIYVDHVLNTEIHTSCSQPIGPGLQSGDFLVIAGTSRNGGELCPVDVPPPNGDCGKCDGKVVSLVLANIGHAGKVTVKQKDGTVVFHGYVASGEEFSFTGTDKKGTLGTEISIYVNHILNTKIHTSCSQPIGPGLQSGDFLVIAGTSRNGGELCPVDAPPPDDECGKCEGKVNYLLLRNDGPQTFVTINTKDGDTIFNAIIAAGEEFAVYGVNGGAMGTWIYVMAHGTQTDIHTSCSQPIGPGSVFGLFTVIEGTSVKGGVLCANNGSCDDKSCKSGKSDKSGKSCKSGKSDKSGKDKSDKSGKDKSDKSGKDKSDKSGKDKSDKSDKDKSDKSDKSGKDKSDKDKSDKSGKDKSDKSGKDKSGKSGKDSKWKKFKSYCPWW